MEGGCGDRVVGCTVGCSEVGDGEVGSALASTVGDWKGCRVGLPLGEPLGWLLGGAGQLETGSTLMRIA